MSTGFYPEARLIDPTILSLDATTKCKYNMDQSFTWDEAKRRKNIRKHGIDFFDAITIFNGEILIIEDTRFNYGEIRYIALGLMRRIVIVVVFTERGEVIRIISARKATKNEERRFYEQIGN